MNSDESAAKRVEETTSPYCGGCGHRYFDEPELPISVAMERAKDRRCLYCYDDMRYEEEKKRGR